MQKGGKRIDVEYLDQPKPWKTQKPAPEKKTWMRRHPLISVIGVGVLSVALAFALKNGCEEKAEKERPGLIKKDAEREFREQIKKDRIEKLEKIKQIIKFQKKLYEEGWYEKQQKQEREREEREDDRFDSQLEKMSKNELIELLVKQTRVLSRLREEYGQGDSDTNEEVARELTREEKRQVAIQDQIDFIEIEERGLVLKSPEELEELIRELDEVIAQQEYYPFEGGPAWDITSERTLLAKALEEVSFWNDLTIGNKG